MHSKAGIGLHAYLPCGDRYLRPQAARIVHTSVPINRLSRLCESDGDSAIGTERKGRGEKCQAGAFVFPSVVSQLSAIYAYITVAVLEDTVYWHVMSRKRAHTHNTHKHAHTNAQDTQHAHTSQTHTRTTRTHTTHTQYMRRRRRRKS